MPVNLCFRPDEFDDSRGEQAVSMDAWLELNPSDAAELAPLTTVAG